MKTMMLSLFAVLGIITTSLSYAGITAEDAQDSLQNIDIESPDDNGMMGRKCPPFC